MANNTRHVVLSSSGGWSVRKAGADRASKTFGTQAEAIDYGREKAKQDAADLFVHGRSGDVLDHRSYKSQ